MSLSGVAAVDAGRRPGSTYQQPKHFIAMADIAEKLAQIKRAIKELSLMEEKFREIERELRERQEEE